MCSVCCLPPGGASEILTFRALPQRFIRTGTPDEIEERFEDARNETLDRYFGASEPQIIVPRLKHKQTDPVFIENNSYTSKIEKYRGKLKMRAQSLTRTSRRVTCETDLLLTNDWIIAIEKEIDEIPTAFLANLPDIGTSDTESDSSNIDNDPFSKAKRSILRERNVSFSGKRNARF